MNEGADEREDVPTGTAPTTTDVTTDVTIDLLVDVVVDVDIVEEPKSEGEVNVGSSVALPPAPDGPARILSAALVRPAE